MSYLKPDVYFHARRDNTGTTQNAAGFITFNLVDANVGNCYNASTGVFTAPVKGLYKFTGVFCFRSGTGIGEVTLYKNDNGSTSNAFNITGNRGLTYIYTTSSTVAGDHDMAPLHAVLELNAGDTIRPYLYQITGGNQLFTDRHLSNWQGQLIART